MGVPREHNAIIRTLTLLLLALAPGITQETAPSFTVAVDARVELLTALARLAEFPEYTRSVGAWPYRDAADAWFAPQRNHEAVQFLRRLRAQHGVSYDAVASLALHLTDLPDLKERIDFASKPERLDQRYPLEATRAFLGELRRFAKDAKAAEFFASQSQTWQTVETRLQARLAGSPSPEWLRAFFGAPALASCVVIPGLLCGDMNFGLGVRFGADKPEELRPVLGCWKFDDTGMPLFETVTLELFAHELAHSWANAVVDSGAQKLDPIGEILFNLNAALMRRQAYVNARTVLYETLVRACVLRCLAATQSLEVAQAQARNDVNLGFTWVPALARALGDYEQARAKFPTLADYLPEIETTLRAQADALVQAAAKAPKLVSITPDNGDTAVDPGLEIMTFVFDRPMRDKSWSFIGRKEDLPEMVGQPQYDAARIVLSIKMRLEPGRSYRFQLNNERSTGFSAQDGTPLQPVAVSFTVRAR